MNRKLLIFSALVVLAVAAALGFFMKRSGDSVNGDAEKSKRAIVVVLPSSTNQFWLDVRRGAEEARAKVPGFRVEIKVSTGDQGAKAQTLMLTDLQVRSDVAAVLLGPASAADPVSALAALDRKGVPSVVIDTTLDPAETQKYDYRPRAFIGSDNPGGAEKAAQAIHDELQRRKIASPYRVLVLEGNRVHQSAIDRADGFYARARTLGMEVEGVRADWNPAKAQEWTAQKFINPRRFHAIFASNDDMALGAVAGLKSLGIERGHWPLIMGFDYTEPAIKAIVAGEMFASVRQDPVRMGTEGVLLAAQAANKDPAIPSKPHYLPADVHPVPAN